jgi:hypothetical protein
VHPQTFCSHGPRFLVITNLNNIGEGLGEGGNNLACNLGEFDGMMTNKFKDYSSSN